MTADDGLYNGKVVPRNRRSRAERIDGWNKSLAAQRRFNPVRATGDDARYRWIAAVLQSDLNSTVRLVAHTLVSHGSANGEKIFPSTRLLAKEAALSERAVCEKLDELVRRGFLQRRPRYGDNGNGKAATGRGFAYGLFIPAVLTDDQRSSASADSASAPEHGTDGASAPC